MKRTIAITTLFVGLNVLIFWITSLELEQEEVTLTDPLSTPLNEPEELLEDTPAGEGAVAEPARTTRPLLLTAAVEDRERLAEEIQRAVAAAIPSLARIWIYWRDEQGNWQQSHVTSVCVDGEGLYAAPWARISRGELFRIQHQDGSFSESQLESFDPAQGIALIKSSDPGKSRPAVFSGGLSLPFGTALQFIWLDQNNSPQASRGHLSGVKYASVDGFPDVISGYLLPDIQVRAQQEGGMLIDHEGRMVGLLVQLNEDTWPPSILSAEDILHVCRHLKQLGYVSRSEFGLVTQPLNPDLIQGLGWEGETAGILVTEVKAGRPADLAGIQVGDLIVELNGRRVMRSGFFHSVLSRWPENKPVVLGVRRGMESIQLELMPEMVPAAGSQAAGVSPVEEVVADAEEPAPPISGEVRNVMLSGVAGEYMVVNRVDPRQLLFSPPLEREDVIVRIANQDQAEPELTVEHLIKSLQANDHLVLLCYRDGRYFWSSGRLLESVSRGVTRKPDNKSAPEY